jgi:hypothetical protein
MKTMLNNRRILAAGDAPGEFDRLKEEIASAAPQCCLDVAAGIDEAQELMASYSYDLMIFGMKGERGQALLDYDMRREKPFPVVMLDRGLVSTEMQQKLLGSGVKTHVFEKERPVPFLEHVLSSDYAPFMRRVMNKIRGTGTGSRL